MSITLDGTTGITSPAIDLTTPLVVADGGTGVSTSTGSGSVVLSTAPTLTSPVTAGTPTGVGVLTSGTSVSASGTSVDFTGIPSWVKRITVMLNAVSGSGTSNFMIQLGDSGGVETTGYTGAVNRENNVLGFSTGFILMFNTSAVNTHIIPVVINNVNANNWMCSFISTRSDTFISYGAGSKELSATLDRVRITTVNGTDTFDAGSINILFE
jgi:hypothetical protein